MTLLTRPRRLVLPLSVALAWTVAFACVSAQEAQLSDEAVAAALAAGAKAQGRQQGLRLDHSSGFEIEIFTPTMWIRQAASEAAAQSRRIPAPLPAELLAPVLRVMAYPIMPRRQTPAGVSVESVVVRDRAKQTVVRPSAAEPTVHEVTQNDFGTPVTLRGLKAQFPLESLRQVQDAKGEFLITLVSSEGRETDIRVKQKQLAERK